MKKRFEGALTAVREVARDIFELTVESDLARTPSLPGQFVHVAVPGGDLLLRRPISLYDVDRTAGVFRLIVQQKGEGTARLCALAPGAKLDLLGPLGRGFTLPAGARRVALAGGGIGAAPLCYCLRKWPGVEFEMFVGFRGAQYAYGLHEFGARSRLYAASDDGSLGQKGFVTELLAQRLEQQSFDAVLACGPLPMLRALARVMAAHPDIPCQISLEERMGCGVGACRVCACRIREAGEERYMRVCRDGPVFPIEKVVLE
ncbi:MAG: dihydroorotate dehydrogenase electron transfer subunit [Clostridiales bacterium]|nr:dihydroorotate dehydrogenase electron transfer subunit [Clostridiales bacterium]